MSEESKETPQKSSNEEDEKLNLFQMVDIFVEFGYKACESKKNLQITKEEARRIFNELWPTHI